MSMNIAALRQKLQELKTGKSSQNTEYLRKFYNPPYYDESNAVRSTIRILPSNINDESGELIPFFSETKLHKINGHNVHCPKTQNKPCPICNYIRDLWTKDDPATKDERSDIKAKKKYYLNVIARERVVLNETTGKEEIVTNDGPLIYSIGVKVFERVLKSILDDEIGDITNLATGFDFKVKKEKSASGYPSYDDCAPARKSSVAGTAEEVEKWMNNLNDLRSLITFKTFEELEQELKAHITSGTTNANGTTPNSGNSEPAIENSTVVTPTPAQILSAAADEEVDDEDFLTILQKIKKKSE